MRRRTLHVELSGVGSLIRGHGSRELITEVTGRAPIWVTLSRGWSVQEHTARDVVALAEGRGYDVVIGRLRGDQAPAVPAEPAPVVSSPTGGRRFPADQEWAPASTEDTLW